MANLVDYLQRKTESAQDEVKILKQRIAQMEESIDKAGYQIESVEDGIFTFVKKDSNTVINYGDYTVPIHWDYDQAVQQGLWYYTNNSDIPHEAIKSGVPVNFYDREYFDFVEGVGI